MSLGSIACSTTFALQPITRFDAKVGVNISGAMSHAATTTDRTHRYLEPIAAGADGGWAPR